jgi:hypothetical protein
MPALHANPTGSLRMEIISPRRTPLQDTVVCDCCRRLKLASEFDQDCCGICADCLDADPVLLDLDATSEQAFADRNNGGRLNGSEMAFYKSALQD